MTEVPEEIGERISELDIWGIQFGRLASRVEFEKYSNAVDFANKVFELADEAVTYPTVKVKEEHVDLDIGDEDITGEDVDLALKIENKLKEMDL